MISLKQQILEILKRKSYKLCYEEDGSISRVPCPPDPEESTEAIMRVIRSCPMHDRLEE